MKYKNFFTLILGVMVALLVVSCQQEDELPFDTNDQTDGQDGLGGQDGDDGQGGQTDFGNGLVGRFTVSGTQLSLIQSGPASSGFYNETRQQEFWKFYTDLIPSDLWPFIKELTLFADEQDGTAAYMGPLSDNNLSRWEMGWNLSFVWDENQEFIKGETAYTAIHEYAHGLTLHAGQVNVNTAGCSSFSTWEGCTNPDSYLNLFFQRFWTAIIEEHRHIGEDDFDALDNFHRKYRDQFVTAYAATNPAEDIAETFAVFVTQDIPTGNSIADQKVQFLYDFNELVVIRQRIRDNIDFNINLSAIGKARTQRARPKHDHKHF